MTYLRWILAAVVLSVLGGTASAATVSFQNIPATNDGPVYVTGPVEGITVTLRSAFDGALGGGLRFNSAGVGVFATPAPPADPDGSNELDGLLNDDAIVIEFSAPVSLDRVRFGNVDSNDVIVIGTALGASDIGTFNVFDLFARVTSLGVGSLFAFEARSSQSDLRIRDIDFTPAAPIPLPAPALLLLGALGLLGAMRLRARR